MSSKSPARARSSSARRKNLALFDLMFRDLLMDRTGNTHRAEISVDKLWNAFAASGRLGLVELRAFRNQSRLRRAIRHGAVRSRYPRAPRRRSVSRRLHSVGRRITRPLFLALLCLAGPRGHLRRSTRARHSFRSRMAAASVGIPLSDAGRTFPQNGAPPLRRRKPWSLKSLSVRLWKRGLCSENSRAATAAPPAPSIRAQIVSRPASTTLPRFVADSCSSTDFPASSVQSRILRSSKEANASAYLQPGYVFRAFYLHPALHPHVPVHSPLLIEWVDRTTLTVLAAARWHVWNPRSVPYTSRPQTTPEARVRFAERWETWPHTIGQPRFIQKAEFPPEARYTLGPPTLSRADAKLVRATEFRTGHRGHRARTQSRTEFETSEF